MYTTNINGYKITIKHTPAEFIAFIGENSIECHELYIDGAYMGNYSDLDALNDWFNNWLELQEAV